MPTSVASRTALSSTDTNVPLGPAPFWYPGQGMGPRINLHDKETLVEPAR